MHLPNGTILRVKYSGDIDLKNGLTLKEVLHIPSFYHNLLSVSKLTKTNGVTFIFRPEFCLIQDQKTNKTVAVSKSVGNLYCLDSTSFKTRKYQTV